MVGDFAHGPLGHFTREVLAGKIREVRWTQLLNGPFHEPDSTQQDAWNRLRAWAKEHDIVWHDEIRVSHGRETIWVLLGPRHGPR